MEQLFSDPIALIIALPLLSGIVCLLLPRALEKLRTVLAVLVAAVTVYFGGRLFLNVLSEGAQSLELWARPGLLRIDTLSSFVLLATTIFGLLIALYSVGFMKGAERQRAYYGYLLWTLGASCGAVLANDLILLLGFWGFLGMTLYLMIGIAGPTASDAAKKTFVIIGGSDCVFMLGIALVWIMTGSTRMDGSALSFARPPMGFGAGHVYAAFLCFAVAAFAKAGAMPFHSWVPDCGEKAPVPVVAFLPASLDKLLGIYLLARAATGMFAMTSGMGTLLMIVGAGTVIFAGMMALIQHNMKRLLSYQAVSGVGYMVLGIGTGNPIGIAGGLFHMLNHAIYKSCLFLCAGAVEKKAGSTDLDKIGGLARAMPLTFGACFVVALAGSGIPPLNGFASKWMMYQGIIETGKTGGALWIVWLAAAILGSALTLASFAKILHATFLCKASPELEKKEIREVGPSMWLPVTVLAALCILFGVLAYRLPIKYFIGPAVAGLDLAKLPGIWYAAPATLALVAAFVLGLILYFLSTVRTLRETETYIGGELMDETYIKGLSPDEARHVEVTGVDFYRTVQELMPLKSIYKAAQGKWFDLYDVGTRTLFYFVEALRSAHAGRLPLYLTWVLAGLLALIFVLGKV
ncbi:MAG: NADH-quinone oxidoreductase subunit L [Candidatus Latescibacteria bacterium]|nr:NADH-quinone oxidoreductase subunit L [Candidatus Latescibacterota bacterium]